MKFKAANVNKTIHWNGWIRLLTNTLFIESNFMNGTAQKVPQIRVFSKKNVFFHFNSI